MATKKTTNKAVETKEVKAIETKKVAKNEEKKNVCISIEEVSAMYDEAGIQCKNPEAKGNYRIMKGGSSLNIKPTKGYYIYSTDDDFTTIVGASVKAEDLVCEKGTNSQDDKRPNTVICKTVETLKELLALYAKNPLNQKVTETAVAVK